MKLLLSGVLLANAFASYAQTDKIFIADGASGIYLGLNEPIAFAGGGDVLSNTLDFDGTLYLRGAFRGYYKLKRGVVFGGITSSMIADGTTMLEITEGLKVQGGSTFNANARTTMLSTALWTANVEELSASDGITNDVIVQRYVPGGRRSYRMMAHPFTGSKTLTETVLDDFDVTGTGGATNGFVPTQTNSPSAYYFDAASGDANPLQNAGWKPFTNTTSTNWARYQGANLMIRGSKGEGLVGQTYVPSTVTIDFQGEINQQNQTIPLYTGVANSTNNYNVVGNPYPSTLAVKRAINALPNLRGGAYWVWETTVVTSAFINQNGLASYGKWQPVLLGANTYLPGSSSILLDVNNAGNIVFFESDKVTQPELGGLFKTTNNDEVLAFKIYSDSATRVWDKMYVKLDPTASDSIDAFDAVKPLVGDVNFFGYAAGGEMQSVTAFSYLPGKVIPLGLKSTQQRDFEIRVSEFNIDPSHNLYLYDNYLNTSTLLTASTVYSFSVTSDTLTQGNRFQLGLQALDVPGVASVGNTWSLYPNPNTGIFYITTGSALKKDASLHVMDMQGRIVSEATMKTGRLTMQVDMSSLAAGVYTAIITSEGSSKTVRKFVKK